MLTIPPEEKKKTVKAPLTQRKNVNENERSELQRQRQARPHLKSV